MRPAYVLISFVIMANNVFAQKKFASNYKFGNITVEDFAPKIKNLDSNAQAVILFNKGTATYVSDRADWFNVEYVYHKKIRILSKNQFALATVEIPFFKGSTKEDKIEKIEAVTYNLENNIIVATKMDKESVYNDKASKNLNIKKFTLPNLKEGCVIEYTYTIISPNAYNLRNWFFQDNIPVLQSEYEITVPTLFDFIFLTNGYYELIPKKEESFQVFDLKIGSRLQVYNAITNHFKWSLTNLPALKQEKFTTSIKNHIAKIEFQLKTLNYPNDPKPFMTTWNELVKTILNSEQFGADLSSKNNWLNDDLKSLGQSSDSVTTAKNIYNYIRDNFICTNYDAIQIPENLKKSYDAKKGNVAEINLLLIAMLRKAHFKADPVIISTTDNGKAYELYPLVNKFNYVLAQLVINDKVYILDASRKKLGFNFLPQYCYNGFGRLISDIPYMVNLSADSLNEKKTTNIFISNKNDNKNIAGTYTSNLGYYESYDLRESLKENEIEDYFKKIKNSFSYDLTLSNKRIDSLKKLDESVSLSYDFEFGFNEDIVYFNPLFSEGYKSNPLTAATRNYPVEMPFRTQEVIVVNMEIPKGYKVDELPKSLRISYNENQGFFDYIISADKETIQLKCKVKFNNATYPPEDYESLREFYSQIVKKQSEQIVFKKIK